MAYRFKARSTTPGQYRLAANTLAQLIALTNIRNGIGRGDGGTGTVTLPAEEDVEATVQYGAGGTEFTGTLAAGGGGGGARIIGG